MSGIAIDTNAAIDLMRVESTPPDSPRRGQPIFLPLPVAGELFVGAYSSKQVARNLAVVEDVAKRWTVIFPTIDTARLYGQLRAAEAALLSRSKLNDLWIAALCLEHNLPLLTNDHGFDHIAGLSVVHW